jgi:hypothetical protein
LYQIESSVILNFFTADFFLVRPLGHFDRSGSGPLLVLACGTCERRRERVVAGTGSGSFADPASPLLPGGLVFWSS